MRALQSGFCLILPLSLGNTCIRSGDNTTSEEDKGVAVPFTSEEQKKIYLGYEIITPQGSKFFDPRLICGL